MYLNVAVVMLKVEEDVVEDRWLEGSEAEADREALSN